MFLFFVFQSFKACCLAELIFWDKKLCFSLLFIGIMKHLAFLKLFVFFSVKTIELIQWFLSRVKSLQKLIPNICVSAPNSFLNVWCIPAVRFASQYLLMKSTMSFKLNFSCHSTCACCWQETYREERVAPGDRLAIFNISQVKTMFSKLIPQDSAAAISSGGWRWKGSCSWKFSWKVSV